MVRSKKLISPLLIMLVDQKRRLVKGATKKIQKIRAFCINKMMITLKFRNIRIKKSKPRKTATSKIY